MNKQRIGYTFNSPGFLLWIEAKALFMQVVINRPNNIIMDELNSYGFSRQGHFHNA